MARFDNTVHMAWESFVGYGSPDSYLAAKLRYLKGGIKKWKKQSDKAENQEILQIKDDVAQLERLVESRQLTESELAIRNHGLQRILDLEKIAILDLK